MIGRSGPAAFLNARSTAVERSNSGLPDNPPCSSRLPLCSVFGRWIVVFDTMRPESL